MARPKRAASGSGTTEGRRKRFGKTVTSAILAKAVAKLDAGTPLSTPQSRQAEREIIVTLRLPRELHARLKALGGERGLTREIRERLEASISSEAIADDPKTREVTAALAGAATMVLEGYGKRWHEDPFAFEVYKAAAHHLLDTGLDRSKPPGEPIFVQHDRAAFAGLSGHTPEEVANLVKAAAIVAAISVKGRE